MMARPIHVIGVRCQKEPVFSSSMRRIQQLCKLTERWLGG